MAKKSAKLLNVSVATVALEGYVNNAALDITQEAPDITCISDLGPRVVVGNYGYTLSLDGPADFAAGAADATIYGMVGTTAVKALAFDPTGSTAAGADDPHYDAADIVLTSYGIRAAVGQSVTYTARMTGNSSMARVVA